MARLHMPPSKRSSNIGLLSLAQFLLLAWVCNASLTVETTVTGEVVFDQKFYVEWTGGDASTYKVLVQQQESTGDGAAVTVASSATSPYSYSFDTGVWAEGHFVFIVESDDEQADSNILTVTSSIAATTATTSSTSTPATTPATTVTVEPTTTTEVPSSETTATAATTSTQTEQEASSSSASSSTETKASSLSSSSSSDSASTIDRSKATASSGSTAASATSTSAAADSASSSSSSSSAAAGATSATSDVSVTAAKSSSGLSTGASIGIGVGVGIAGLLLIGALLLYVYRRGIQAAAAKKNGLYEKELAPDSSRGGTSGGGIWPGAADQNSYLATAAYNGDGGHVGAGHNRPVELDKDINRPYAELHPNSTQFAELGHNDTSYYAELAAARENV